MTSLRLLLAFGVALSTAILLTPLAIRVARRTGLLDFPRGFKAHLVPTPCLGGAGVMAAFAAGALLAAWSRETVLILGGALFLSVVGALDDGRTVRPLYRVLVSGTAGAGLWSAGYGWSLFENEVGNFGVTLLWVVGVVNAFNLLDNIDGAAATVASVSAAGIAAFALVEHQETPAAISLALSGACLGFLKFNLCRPARIFLGDGGSMPIGFSVAALILAAPSEGRAGWDLIVPASLLVALPVFDTSLVIVSRLRRGARIYLGNVDHLTHRLCRRLPSVRWLALVLALGQGIFCALGLAVVWLQPGDGTLLVLAGSLLALGSLGIWFFDSPGWIHPVPGPKLAPGRDRPVRVLRVIARMNVGGPAYHVSLLSGRLDPERYETLLVSGNVGPGEASFAELATRYGARLQAVESLGPEIRPFRDLRALVDLIRIARRYRPDIVHTHTAKAGLLGRVAALFAGRPRPLIVHTYHGHVLEGYFGRLQSGFYRLLERRLARVSDCLIGVSEATVDDLVRLRVAPREKFRIIRVGLELERFATANGPERARFREEVGARDDDVLFACVGRLVPIKRVDRAIRAVAKAHAAGAPVRLAIVGDGVLREDLEALTESLGLDGHVRFLGYRGDLEAVTTGCDAALLTSDNEGTPVALIEAAASGRPAVATSVGGVPEVVGDSGLLVPQDDERSLTEAIVQLAENPALRAELGQRGRDRVLDRFASGRLLRDIDALYGDLLAARS